MFLDQIPKKNHRFFWNSTKFQKNLEFSKIPKIFGEVHKSFGILENSRFFLNFGKFKKNQGVFFGILVENLKKTCVFFLEFAIKF